MRTVMRREKRSKTSCESQGNGHEDLPYSDLRYPPTKPAPLPDACVLTILCHSVPSSRPWILHSMLSLIRVRIWDCVARTTLGVLR